MEIRLTVDLWKHIPAGTKEWDGNPNEYRTAPSEPGLYTLYELTDENNCHVGWEWEREET